MSDGEARGRSAKVLCDVLAWSRERDYAGYSKHDALNSPVLNALTLNFRPLRLVMIQAVMRCPFNPRGLLGVPQLRNPKGIGLFAHAWFDLADAVAHGVSVPGLTREQCIGEGQRLLAWLVHHASPWTPMPDALREMFPEAEAQPMAAQREGLRGVGWGYHYPWQDVGFFQPRHFPNRVVSSWIGYAFFRAYEVLGEDRYLDVVRHIVRFHLENPKRFVDTADQLCLSYVPKEEVDAAVMDVSALVAALCARLASTDGNRELADTARRLMHFVVDKQTGEGAWFYTWPAEKSHIKHDNYHTGIILDCLADYMAYAGDTAWSDVYLKGLSFYRDRLFTEMGAPKWMHDKTYPHDIHGAAAGIMAFDRAVRFFRNHGAEVGMGISSGFSDVARHIESWTFDNLYNPEGFFYYQVTARRTKKFNLMRWCNAWMARALAQQLRFDSADKPVKNTGERAG